MMTGCALAVVLVLVLILAAATRRAPSHDGFGVGTFQYLPSCGRDEYGRRRNDCRGFTGGAMPSIEVESNLGNGLCGSYLGVPP